MNIFKHGTGERGSTLVEFVILLPILMFLLFGIFEISRLWLTIGVVAEAARQGARVAAVDSPFSNTAGIARANAVLAAANLTAVTGYPTITCSGSPCAANDTITSTVRVTFQTPIPLLATAFGSPRPVQHIAQMRFE
jgi:Flp pilus assembly protein TadG